MIAEPYDYRRFSFSRYLGGRDLAVKPGSPATDAVVRRSDGERPRLAELYVREAHPGPREPPRRDAADKLRRARELVEREGLDRPVLVDDLEGTINRAFGAVQNGVAVIGADGEHRVDSEGAAT